MAPKEKKAKEPKKLYDYSGLEQGMRCQAESDGAWYAVEIVQVSTSKNRAKAPVKVSYKGYDGYDEWVSGERLRSKALKVTTEKKEPKEKKPTKVTEKYVLNYFPLWAKGPAIALALDHAGVDWEGIFIKPGCTMESLAATDPPFKDWKEIKADQPFGELPVLQVGGKVGLISHELTILNYIGRKHRKQGKDDKEFVISGQVMQMAEDIYQKLVKVQPTILAPKEDLKEETAKFWADTDATTHNLQQGVGVYLSLLEKFHSSCENGVSYTKSGTTVGECKLFASLHALKLIKDDCLAAYPAVAGFYAAFAAHEKTKPMLENGSKYPHALAQYFVAGK
eukprot:gnl/TRDRNA2_/TRDRNA2_173507_c0_seq4.p1 gnl/TRDRNA2_/TRDRNA2_173507_c0~~gnl/TRDRNA2_/TRDRNA2_173507_c0_seq4.p1  ORF type:complete len:364 (+),score=94.15 gnl/TRDRNA2_/TRDRNA2_173507_c0_seq4:83-1093(+)